MLSPASTADSGRFVPAATIGAKRTHEIAQVSAKKTVTGSRRGNQTRLIPVVQTEGHRATVVLIEVLRPSGRLHDVYRIVTTSMVR